VKLVVRLFIDCPSASRAMDLAQRLNTALAVYAPSLREPPKLYWRDARVYVITFELHPATERPLLELMASVPTGWQYSSTGSNSSGVWNRVSTHVLLLPEVRWAEVELFGSQP